MLCAVQPCLHEDDNQYMYYMIHLIHAVCSAPTVITGYYMFTIERMKKFTKLENAQKCFS